MTQLVKRAQLAKGQCSLHLKALHQLDKLKECKLDDNLKGRSLGLKGCSLDDLNLKGCSLDDMNLKGCSLDDMNLGCSLGLKEYRLDDNLKGCRLDGKRRSLGLKG